METKMETEEGTETRIFEKLISSSCYTMPKNVLKIPDLLLNIYIFIKYKSINNQRVIRIWQ